MLASLEMEVTAVEIDPELATALRERFPAVRVLDGRGEALAFPDATFTAVLSFTMLHHVHSTPDDPAALPDRLATAGFGPVDVRGCRGWRMVLVRRRQGLSAGCAVELPYTEPLQHSQVHGGGGTS